MLKFRRISPLFKQLISSTKQIPSQTHQCSSVAQATTGGTSTFGYRGAGTYYKNDHLQARIILFLTWFWMSYRFFQEPDHVLGHFKFPNPKKWTDEELGIPPEDE